MTDAAPYELARDRHLFGPGPKRILALDGGGVRGALSVAFLERIEALLRERHGPDTRLGDHFDLVGGTSTGAIIATAIALGLSTAQVKHFYLKLAPLAFKRQRWSVPVLQPKFDAQGLRSQLEAIIGGRELSSPDLITGLGVISKRVDTGSPWIVSNNPRAPFWEDGKGVIGNKHYRLANLVRASTAAPHFFDPQWLPICETEANQPDAAARPAAGLWPSRSLRALGARFGMRRGSEMDPNVFGLFVDGGVTPHNNPSLALFHMATLGSLGIGWSSRPDALSITSIGTGTYRPRLTYQTLGAARYTKMTYHALTSMISDSEMLVLALMQWMGECPAPWPINSEVGTFAGDAPPGGKIFGFLRYDVTLDKDWLARELNVKTDDRTLARLRNMDDPGMVHQLYEIGCAAAEKQVKSAHWLD